MLAYRELMGGDPEAGHTRTSEALSAWGPLPPEAAYTLHAVHGAAQADWGSWGRPGRDPRGARRFRGPDRIPSFRSALVSSSIGWRWCNGNPTAAVQVADG